MKKESREQKKKTNKKREKKGEKKGSSRKLFTDRDKLGHNRYGKSNQLGAVVWGEGQGGEQWHGITREGGHGEHRKTVVQLQTQPHWGGKKSYPLGGSVWGCNQNKSSDQKGTSYLEEQGGGMKNEKTVLKKTQEERKTGEKKNAPVRGGQEERKNLPARV